jgi:geranyl-CoA carboxylase alpha subunit
MGNKAEAKRLMLAAGVPCVPGYSGEQSDEALIAASEEIGFPLMVKAAAGGGGRGMRFVANRGDLPAAVRLARAEAHSAFGSGELILEQAILEPRHVEFQIIADAAGHTVHLGERDCSVQRRHQKIIEEAPCPVLTAELRGRMGSAAVRAAEAIDYRGAGTVEFLLDGAGNFYFLEMNTRLQVEHPVTELVTGLDLVELQIRIARGESLGLTQDAIGMRGHAIEARLYTEDPGRDFMPTTGRIERWRAAEGDGVRVDAGIREGQEISPYYDALAAKVIAWGETRDIARRRLIAALKSTVLFGPRTNKSFLIECLKRERFAKAEATTGFVAEEMAGVLEAPALVSERAAVLAAAILFRLDREAALAAGAGVSHGLLNWSSGLSLASRYRIESDGVPFDVSLSPRGDEHYLAMSNGRELTIEIVAFETDAARVSIDGQRIRAAFCRRGRGALWLSAAGSEHLFSRRVALRSDDGNAVGGGRITAAMHGVVRELAVAAGARVEQGGRLLTLEAMKMQQEILAPVAGEVTAIHVREGQQVATGDVLMTIAEDL